MSMAGGQVVVCECHGLREQRRRRQFPPLACGPCVIGSLGLGALDITAEKRALTA